VSPVRIENVTLRATVAEHGKGPKDALPQVAFAGRSNVGKSSLLNSLFGQRLAAVGEDFAHQVAHAAQVAGAGDEGANFEHGVAAGFAGQGFEGVAHLGGKQAAGGEGGDVEGEAAGFAGDGSRQFLGKLQDLGNLFLLGLGFFLCALSRSKHEAAGRRHERQPLDGVPGGSRCRQWRLGVGRYHGLDIRATALGPLPRELELGL